MYARQHAYPVPQRVIALLLTWCKEVARFIVPFEAATVAPIGDEPRPGGLVPEVALRPRKCLFVGHLQPFDICADRLPAFWCPVPPFDLAADVLQAVIELHVLVAPAHGVRGVPVGSDKIGCEPADRNHATLKLRGP